MPGIERTTVCLKTESDTDIIPVEKSACTIFRNRLSLVYNCVSVICLSLTQRHLEEPRFSSKIEQ